MKAFLAHSSRDKALVERVANALGGANIELDSVSFEQGVLNTQAVQAALKRTSLFILFASRASVHADFATYETLRAEELNARGIVERILIICLDADAFGLLRETLKQFNLVRTTGSFQGIARLIQHQLILADVRMANIRQPFVGRQKELADAKEHLIDPERPPIRSLYVSGTVGIGRRTFAKKLYADVFPYVHSIFPEIEIDRLDGYSELYRKIIDVNTPIIALTELRDVVERFEVLDDDGKAETIAQSINDILTNREAIFFIDRGGVLDDAGHLQGHLAAIEARIASYPHPPLIFITERMIGPRTRQETRGSVFCALPALSREDTRQLTALLLKREGVVYSADELDKLTDLSDFHPFNVSFIVQSAKQLSIPVCLADTTELVQWKRRQGAEFLQKVQFTPVEVSILSALRDFRTLDFGTLSSVVEDQAGLAEGLAKLIEHHVIEAGRDMYSISPPLRAAAERDHRLMITAAAQKKILQTISQTLSLQGEGGDISIPLVEAGILAQLQSEKDLPALFSVFLLPSHLVWLARKRYDETNYKECMRLASAALDDRSRLSKSGVVEACTRFCLAAARLAKDAEFNRGIAVLHSFGNDRWANSRSNFLRGFHARLSGYLPEAEELYRRSYELSPGDFHTARELAHVCKVRGRLDEAEKFARRAYQIAPDNPYIIDILIGIILNLPATEREKNRVELDELLDRLKQFGDGDGNSFYAARTAELEQKRGNLGEAIRLVDKAVRITPKLFTVHALRAQVYLDQGNKTIVAEEIREMERILGDGTSERRTGLRQLLEIKSAYLTLIGSYKEAKSLFETNRVFSEEERAKGIKSIDFDAGRRR